MNGRKLTREEIWQRIRQQGGRQEYILSEMKRLGFWPSDNPQPTVAESFLEEQRKLQERLRALSAELAKVENPDEALKLMHKERKAAALLRREETRRKRNLERYQRACAWHERQRKEITWLGDGRFPALARKELDHARLAAQKLPLIGNAAELANAMGITLQELRFLCYQRDVSTVSHYQRFSIPKKSGGERIISAPMPRLKRAQYWLLENILDRIPPTDSAQGFVKERNIVSNAAPHVAKAVVINLDLENFFPSISYARVKGIYRQLGYSEEVAMLCALLSTELETSAYELDGQKYFVKTGAAALPQGAPTSPALSNLLCRRLDKRLRGAAAKLGFAYTRYADDLTFSAPATDNQVVKKLLWRVRKIVAAEGLKIHPRKTRVMRKHQRQEVTGIVVNQKPTVARDELRKFRALLFQIEKDGPEGKRWRDGPLFDSIEGFAHFVAMVDPDKGRPLRQRVLELRRKYQAQAQKRRMGPLSPHNFRGSAKLGRAPREQWWMAQAKPAPELELTPNELKEREKREKAAREAEEAAQNRPSQPPPQQPSRRQEPASRSWRSPPPPGQPQGDERQQQGDRQRQPERQNDNRWPARDRQPSSRISWWGWLIIIWIILQVVRLLTK